MKIPHSDLRWILDADVVDNLLRELQIRDSAIRFVREAIQQVSQSQELPQFFEFCRTWRDSRDTDNTFSPQWNALAVISTFPEIIEEQRQRGIPWKITRATLADFERDARGEYLHSDSWTFQRLRWLRNHVTNRLFELGRLQYEVGTFAYPFRVYRDEEKAEIVALALPELPCDEWGWITDNNAAFITKWCEDDNDICAQQASPKNGAISRSARCIPANSPALLSADSTVLQIHIPSGEKMTRDKCVESLKMAIPFFEKYFSGIHIDALCTATWLLDRELAKVLLPTSNIVEFGNLFHPLARRYSGDDKQLLERAFGVRDWKNCVAKNTFQQAILEHHNNGGAFHNTAGFILREEINAL